MAIRARAESGGGGGQRERGIRKRRTESRNNRADGGRPEGEKNRRIIEGTEEESLGKGGMRKTRA